MNSNNSSSDNNDDNNNNNPTIYLVGCHIVVVVPKLQVERRISYSGNRIIEHRMMMIHPMFNTICCWCCLNQEIIVLYQSTFFKLVLGEHQLQRQYVNDNKQHCEEDNTKR